MSNQREKFGSRLLNDEEDVFSQNAWDNVQLDEDQIRMSEEKIRENSERKMLAEESAKYDQKANEFWNEFYRTHSDKFFKERNWIFIDFPELIGNCSEAQKQAKFEREFSDKMRLVDSGESSDLKADEAAKSGHVARSEVAKSEDPARSEDVTASEVPKSEDAARPKATESRSDDENPDEKELRIFEIGCGTGSTIRTILNVNTNPKTTVYCCDFSSNAIDILKKHASYDSRCHAFVNDCTDTQAELPFEEGSLDIIVMIFTLSAIRPEKMQATIANACKYLKPGGCFLFRDYGRYDMAQLRFKPGKCISDNCYVRGDGTQAYFFTEEEIERLFTQTGLMRKEWIYVDRRLQTNRIKKLKMYRVYVQAKFCKI